MIDRDFRDFESTTKGWETELTAERKKRRGKKRQLTRERVREAELEHRDFARALRRSPAARSQIAREPGAQADREKK
jgi:hypothetical protein